MAKVTKDQVFESLFKPLYTTSKALEIYYLTKKVIDGPMYMRKRVLLNPGIYCEAYLLYPDHPDYDTYEGYLEIGLTGNIDDVKGTRIVREAFVSVDIEELKDVYDLAMRKFRRSLQAKVKLMDELDETGWDEEKFKINPNNGRQEGWVVFETETEKDRSETE